MLYALFFLIKLLKLNNLEDAFRKLTILANDLNLNLTSVVHSSNSSRPSQLQRNANEIWKTLSPVICGHSYNPNGEAPSSGDDIVPDLLGE